MPVLGKNLIASDSTLGSEKGARSQRRRKYIPVASTAGVFAPSMGLTRKRATLRVVQNCSRQFCPCGGRFANRAPFPSLIDSSFAVLKTRCGVEQRREYGVRSKASHARDGVCRAIRDETASLRSGPVFHPDRYVFEWLLYRCPTQRSGVEQRRECGVRSKASHARDGVCRAIRDETASLRSGPVFHPDKLGLSLLETKKACFFKQAFRIWSAREDSNLRPTGPKPVALPSCATRRWGRILLLPL